MSLLSQLIWKVRRNHAPSMRRCTCSAPPIPPALVGRSDWNAFRSMAMWIPTPCAAASDALANCAARRVAGHPSQLRHQFSGGDPADRRAAYLAATLPARSAAGRVMRVGLAMTGAVLIARPWRSVAATHHHYRSRRARACRLCAAKWMASSSSNRIAMLMPTRRRISAMSTSCTATKNSRAAKKCASL